MSGPAAVQTPTTARPTITPIVNGLLQRQCACGQHTSAGGECEECKQKRAGTLQRAAINPSPVYDVPPIVHEVLRSPGQPLDPATRAFMEPRFGYDFSRVPTHANRSAHTPAHLTIGAPHDAFEQEAELTAQHVMSQSATSTTTGYDFSGVRIHTDGKASESARAVGALAYTVGREIVFGEEQYVPGTMNGNRLLAHELTHVLQQQAMAGSPSVVQRDDDKGKGGKGKSDKTADKKPEEKAAVWTRKHTKGPRLLDGDNPSYQIWFDHILPVVPKGVTQMWQVVEDTQTFLTDKCENKTEQEFRIDIVSIGDRKQIEDDWVWIRRDNPCFALEVSKATLGFDDQKSNFAEQTNVLASASLAKEVLQKMAGPTGNYSGTYTFIKSSNCKKCPDTLKKLQKAHEAPNGEALTIEGVGSWTSESK